MNKINLGHTAIVAHDAGAAAHIFAWLQSGLINLNSCKFCLAGPAVQIFQFQNPNIEFCSLDSILIGTDTLLTGSDG